VYHPGDATISSGPYSVANSAYSSSGLLYGGTLCPPGSYCLEGSTHPIPCAAGSFSHESGAEVCDPCPAGTFAL
jgi:hypothetical protein